MSSGPPSAAATSIEQIIEESGRAVGPRVGECMRLAHAAQAARRRAGVSDTDLVTRSTFLWAVMRFDDGIGQVLEASGLDLDRFGDNLSIPRDMPSADGPADQVAIHEYFADSLTSYLARLPEHRTVSIVDVTLAVVTAGVDSTTGGLLPQRMAEADVDFERAVARLQQLLPRSPARDAPPLSDDLVELGGHLSPDAVSAFQLARAIATRHPEYAGGQLSADALDDVDSAERRSWTDWRHAVVALYDRATTAASSHKVVDGRLFLAGLCTLVPELRSALDDLGLWTALVVEIDEAAVPADSALMQVLQSLALAHGYDSDRAGGVDRLGIEGDVNALCELLVDPQVRPPLAIGLFGSWGSGKSFFMEQMRSRIDRLTAGDAENGPLEVVQIRFNAWHYADTSLWASIAIEIFERLVDPEPVDPDERARWVRDHGDTKRAEREELLTKLETYRSARAVLDAERAKLQARRRTLEQQAVKARKRRTELLLERRLPDVAAELRKDQRVRDSLDSIATSLGVAPAVEELTALASELRTTAGYLPAVWRLTRHKSLAVTLIAAFVVLLAATAGLLANGGIAAVSAVATAGASIGSVAIAVSKFLRPAARKLNAGLRTVEAAIDTAAGIEAELRERRDEEERKLAADLAELDHQIDEATTAARALDEKIAAAEVQADALRVGRRLFEFLTERAVGYQRHQGIVGTLHRDFRFLDAQLQAYRRSGDPVPGLPTADRVILYIDDLDRCAPSKVLEVLEAIHLLLALELFVVVVGVDPRWLQRSLRHEYRELISSDTSGTDLYLRSMPVEYLEKIFQIPFTMPAMDPQGYASLVGALAPNVRVLRPARDQSHVGEPGTTRPDDQPPPSDEEVPAELHGAEAAPTRGPLVVEEGSRAAGHAASIDLTPGELAFAQALGRLVTTPRAAKRLMNTYRLIRATRHVGPRSRFLGSDAAGGEYQAALVLLAVAAGFPAIADRLLATLEATVTQADISTWPMFVERLNLVSAPGAAESIAPRELRHPRPDEELDGSAMLWARMHTALVACLPAITLHAIDPYRDWGRVVARFSFTL